MSALLLLGVVVGVLSGGGSGSPSASKSSPTTTHTGSSSTGNSGASASHSIAAAQGALLTLTNAWVSGRNTVSTANQTYVNQGNAINADITKQNQRIQQDAATYQQNDLGLGCDSQIASPNFESCVQGEEQTASAAESDSAAANAQLQTDDQQYATNASTYGTALSTFISQLPDLNWPNSMQSIVSDLVTATQAVRSDVSNQAAESPTTPQSTLSEIQAQLGDDIGSMNDAISAVNSALLHLGASLSSST